MSEKGTQKRTLVLFSGGKNSFVTACRRLDEGDFVGLIAFNNGALAAEQNIVHSTTRLINRYGEDRVRYEGIYNTAATIARFSKWYSDNNYTVIHANIPDLTPAQVTCLHCQTAMWVSAIAYAKVHDFSTICAGYRSVEHFCAGSSMYANAIDELALSYGIDTMFPVWYASGDAGNWNIERDLEMTRRSFEPTVLEPKCMLGMPASRFTEKAELELSSYFENYLKTIAYQQIMILARIFEALPLSTTSMTPLECPVPESSRGLY